MLEYVGDVQEVRSVEETQGVFFFTVQEQNGYCRIINPADRGGLARYANQTRNPNVDYVLRDDRLLLIANRNIRIGEEISGNYGDNKAGLDALEPSSAWIYFLRSLANMSVQEREAVLGKLDCLGSELANVVGNYIVDLSAPRPPALAVLNRKFTFGLDELVTLLPIIPALVSMEVEEPAIERVEAFVTEPSASGAVISETSDCEEAEEDVEMTVGPRSPYRCSERGPNAMLLFSPHEQQRNSDFPSVTLGFGRNLFSNR